MRSILLMALMISVGLQGLGAQKQSATQPRQTPGASKTPPPTLGAGGALQFLGAYSAPKAIRETETGHTSAKPPSPAAWMRLREFTGGSRGGDVAAELRRAMLNPRTPSEWFRVGVLSLAAARQASRALARRAPRSVWNRRLTAQALRWARGVTPAQPAALRGSWRRLQEALRGTPTAANLYQRARAAEALGGAALGRAAREPALAARIDGMRALAASQADQIALAAREYRAGLALAPRSAALHAGLGELERAQRRYPAAARQLAIAWRLNPHDAITAFAFGDVEFRLNHPRRALRLLNGAVAMAPKMLVARWTRAEVEGAMGRYRAALRDYLAAQSADHSGKLQYELGRVYLRLGQRRLAAAAFHRSAAQRAAGQR